MRQLAPIRALALVGWPATTTRAGDVTLTIDGHKFTVAAVTMKRATTTPRPTSQVRPTAFPCTFPGSTG